MIFFEFAFKLNLLTLINEHQIAKVSMIQTTGSGKSFRKILIKIEKKVNSTLERKRPFGALFNF